MLNTTQQGPIHLLELARPPANALNGAMVNRLRQGISDAIGADAQALVISGRPGMFCAGLDVPELLQLDRAGMQQFWSDFFALAQEIATSPIAVAAAITGHSPAGGAVLSLFCDYRIMAEGKFRIGLNEVQVGLPLPPSIYEALAYVVGRRQAARLGNAGLLILPDEALRIGLVDEVVPSDAVVARATAWCGELLALPPLARAQTRRVTRAPLIAAFEHLETSVSGFLDVWFSDETQAAMRALVAALSAKRS